MAVRVLFPSPQCIKLSHTKTLLAEYLFETYASDVAEVLRADGLEALALPQANSVRTQNGQPPLSFEVIEVLRLCLSFDTNERAQSVLQLLACEWFARCTVEGMPRHLHSTAAVTAAVTAEATAHSESAAAQGDDDALCSAAVGVQ